MKKGVFALIIIFIISCNSDKSEKKIVSDTDTKTETIKFDKYLEIISKNNIKIEEIENNNTQLNPYDIDNNIYKTGSRFKYDYMINHNGKENFLYKVGGACIIKAPITDKEESGDKIIQNLNFIVDSDKIKGLPPITTAWVKYGIDGELSDELQVTSLIENQYNIWVHDYWNPHLEFIRIAPNPYIKFPAEIGKKWKFEKNIQIRNLYPEFNINHNGIFQVNCDYEVIDYKPINTTYGKLDCFVIEGVAKTENITSKLTSYFNKDKGFVQLKYEFGETLFNLSLNKNH